MSGDHHEVFARVDIKEEHFSPEAIKSEIKEFLDSSTYIQENVESCSKHEDEHKRIGVVDFEVEIKKEPSDEGKFQGEFSPVPVKIEMRNSVSHVNGEDVVNFSTESRKARRSINHH